MAAPQLITLADLDGIESGHPNGANVRFMCPIHGSDHQRSLSIYGEGDNPGYGTCHSCHAAVIVTDWPGRKQWTGPQSKGSHLALIKRKLQADPVAPAPPTDWQKSELETLHQFDARSHLTDARAIEYLQGRGLEVSAEDTALLDYASMGYIPALAVIGEHRKWRDRLVFPTWTPDGIGFAGRWLYGWHPGMDEVEHKAWFDARNKQRDRDHQLQRWAKTAITGYYGPPANELAPVLFLVEGALDRLALLAGGVDASEVIALVGTNNSKALESLPSHVRHVIIAFDCDGPGGKEARAVADFLENSGIVVTIAAMPDDDMGKDASARWRLAGARGIAPILDAWPHVAIIAPAAAPTVAPVAPTPSPEAPAPPAPIMPSVARPGASAGMFGVAALDALPHVDAPIMDLLFAACPWYDQADPTSAPGRAAQWICASETAPTRPDTMAAYALMARLFASAAAVAVTEGIAMHLHVTPAPRQLGLPALVVLLRQAYEAHNFALASSLIDAAISGASVTAQDASEQSYSQRVRSLMAQGIGYFAACAQTTAENLARNG